MKKILIILAFILGSCEIQPKTVKADNTSASNNTLPNKFHWQAVGYGYKEITVENMTYGIWYVNGGDDKTGYALAAVNITKDMLEVELLRKQLTK